MKSKKTASPKLSRRILVIDDDEAILEAFDMMLSSAGYKVETSVKDGEHIQKMIKKWMPHLIILDVLLSGSDGREICKKLKNQKETKHIPIIMISAHPDAQETVLEAGANDFLRKPFEMDELLGMAEKHIKGKNNN